MVEFADRVYQWFLKRVKGSTTGKVLAKGLMAKLRSEIINDPVAIRKALMVLREDGHIEFTPNERGEPISSYITVYKRKQEPQAHKIRWAAVLQSSGLHGTEIDALTPLADAISEFSETDMISLLGGLKKLRSEQEGLNGQHTHLVSARYLLGSSKLLSGMPGRAVKAFGIDTDRFTTHPTYVVVGGCTHPEMVVLVENPASFELAISTNASKQCAFVATFGFGLSKHNEDFGLQLAGMAETGFGDSITLVRQGSSCPPAKMLLNHPKIVFWGDLDMAGMQIFERIATKIPHIQLSALYKPMIDAIQHADRRHPYAAATGSGKPGQKLFRSNRQDVQRILPYCEHYAVDQEVVLPEEIELLADQILDLSILI